MGKPAKLHLPLPITSQCSHYLLNHHPAHNPGKIVFHEPSPWGQKKAGDCCPRCFAVVGGENGFFLLCYTGNLDTQGPNHTARTKENTVSFGHVFCQLSTAPSLAWITAGLRTITRFLDPWYLREAQRCLRQFLHQSRLRLPLPLCLGHHLGQFSNCRACL